MSVFSQFFLAFMGGDFSQFAFSSAGHLNSPCSGIITAQAALWLSYTRKLCNNGGKRSIQKSESVNLTRLMVQAGHTELDIFSLI